MITLALFLNCFIFLIYILLFQFPNANILTILLSFCGIFKSITNPYSLKNQKQKKKINRKNTAQFNAIICWDLNWLHLIHIKKKGKEPLHFTVVTYYGIFVLLSSLKQCFITFSLYRTRFHIIFMPALLNTITI